MHRGNRWVSQMSLRTLLGRREAAPSEVDLPTDDLVVIQRDGGVVVAELVDAPEERLNDDQPRLWQLRVFEWKPRDQSWVCAGWSKGVWHADRREFFIADLEVFPDRRDHGHGTRLLLACLDMARRFGAATVTGNLSDVDDVDRLTQWYRRFGFQVLPPTQSGMAASIRLTI
jgi:GNAT superfamily N-acetyltransferase